MNLTNLNPATIAVLAREAAKAKSATRKSLPLGDTDVEEVITLSVTGKVRCGADYQSHIVLKADPFTMLAVALSHLNGVTVESIVEEARTADPKYVKSIKAQAVKAWGKVRADTLTDCRGAVTFPDATVAVVEAMAIASVAAK